MQSWSMELQLVCGGVHSSAPRKQKEMFVWPCVAMCFENTSTTQSAISRMKVWNNE